MVLREDELMLPQLLTGSVLRKYVPDFNSVDDYLRSY